MADLRIITDQIRQEAEAKATEILNAAEKEYKQITEQYKLAAEKDSADALESARRESEHLTTAAISGAAKDKAQAILSAKNRLIEETLQKAEQSIYALPDAEYMALMEKLLAKQAPKAGEILFNQKDAARLSAGMKNAMEKAGLTLSDTVADIKGGFVLKYGLVEENCAVDALFREHHEALVDIACHELF